MAQSAMGGRKAALGADEEVDRGVDGAERPPHRPQPTARPHVRPKPERLRAALAAAHGGDADDERRRQPRRERREAAREVVEGGGLEGDEEGRARPKPVRHAAVVAPFAEARTLEHVRWRRRRHEPRRRCGGVRLPARRWHGTDAGAAGGPEGAGALRAPRRARALQARRAGAERRPRRLAHRRPVLALGCAVVILRPALPARSRAAAPAALLLLLLLARDRRVAHGLPPRVGVCKCPLADRVHDRLLRLGVVGQLGDGLLERRRLQRERETFQRGRRRLEVQRRRHGHGGAERDDGLERSKSRRGQS